MRVTTSPKGVDFCFSLRYNRNMKITLWLEKNDGTSAETQEKLEVLTHTAIISQGDNDIYITVPSLVAGNPDFVFCIESNKR